MNEWPDFFDSACRRRLEKSKLDGDVTSIGLNANYKVKGQLPLALWNMPDFRGDSIQRQYRGLSKSHSISYEIGPFLATTKGAECLFF